MENNYIFYRGLKESDERWQEFSDSYVKGFVYYNGKLLKGKDLLNAISTNYKESVLEAFLSLCNGNFGALVKIGSDIVLIADKIRSFPILFTIKEKVYCADSGKAAELLLPKAVINNDAEIEFSALGYLSGGNTLVCDVNYVQAGEYVVIHTNMQYEKHMYHSFSGNKCELSKNVIFRKSQTILEDAFNRSINSLGSFSKILIPLSGGYDSRLIACLCKRAGINNVICYTYGKKESFEVIASKHVAESLGFEWHFTEYNDDIWKRTLDSEVFKDYFLYAGCLCGTPHFQDFPALMELKEKGLIDSSTVVIPGHSGDLLGGSKIPVEIMEGIHNSWSKSSLVDLIYKHLFDLNRLDDSSVLIAKQLIYEMLPNYDESVSNIDNYLDSYECEWFIKTRISNFIVNSVRAYEFFGMRWRLPLWDDEYAGLWYSLPWESKFYSKLYNSFMFKTYFTGYDVDLKKGGVTISSVIKEIAKHILPAKIKASYRNKVAIQSASKNRSNFNAFEIVIDYMEGKVDRKLFPFVVSYNHGNINAPTALFYIQSLKNFVR